MSKALLVIDVQNDYFPGGALPLWHPEETLENLLVAIAKAKQQGVAVVFVQHLAEGPGPFFVAGTQGAELHPRLRAAAPDAPVVVKGYADSFHQTTLEATLRGLGVTELLVAGMMTQNCVAHTILSKAADAFEVTLLPDCCTTVSERIHRFALNALSTRVKAVPSSELVAEA